MDRSKFLKTLTAVLGAGPLMSWAGGSTAPWNRGTGATLPWPRFRPGPEGRILVCGAEGQPWTVHVSYGPEFEVLGIREEPGATVAQLRYQGRHAIRLQLDANGQHWNA